MLETDSYLGKCLQLAQSVHIYSTTVAKQVLNYYQLNEDDTAFQTADCVNPYDLHLQGLSSPVDAPATFTSLDTGLSGVLLSSLNSHPKTKQRLLTNPQYRRQFTDGLGKFGHQRLMGQLYPVMVDLPVRDGTILYYDASLVEAHEYSLMSDLQDWIYRSLHRWTNSGYVATDPLYGAALNGIIYAHMVSRIVQLRDAKIHTQEAHSFHVDSYLSDYGLYEYLSVLSGKQKFKLYKDIAWLYERAGQHEAYLYLKNLLVDSGRVTLTEFVTVPSNNVDTTIVKDETFNVVSMEEMARLTNTSYQDVRTSVVNGAVADALSVIQVRAVQTDTMYMDLKRVMINTWGKLANQGKYLTTLTVTLPDSSQRELTALQAFIYYAIHVPSVSYSPNQDPLIYTMPMSQDTSGYTGADLIEFTALQAITRDMFPSTVEKMYNDMVLLRAAIDVTPIEERHFWEGEFPRTYSNYGILLPDKQQWLLEQDLPEMTPEYLDKMVEQFTGYTETMYYSQMNSERLYADMLSQMLSMSTQVVTATDGYQSSSFIQLPITYAFSQI